MGVIGDCLDYRLFIVGYPLEYTLSPPIYIEWGMMNGYRIEYSVERPSSPASLVYYTRMCRDDPCCLGFNVTMPYKTVILGLLDDIDHHARVIEAVNTVYKGSSKLLGTNTDWLGVREPLLEASDRWFEATLMIGAGGAARAAAYAIKDLTGKIIYTSRTGITAVKLAEWTRKTLKIDAEGYKATPETYRRKLEETTLIINASPASGATKTPIPQKQLEKLQKPCTVIDLVYNPPQTLLLKQAQKQKCTTIDGITILATQAAHNIKKWLKKKPNPKTLEKIARKHAQRNPASHHPATHGSQRGGDPKQQQY